MSSASLLWSLFFGCVGWGYFSYGRKQKMIAALICGLTLMIYPYFISNLMVLVGIGVALMALPYFYRY